MSGPDWLTVQAEQNVLGAILYDNAALGAIDGGLAAEHFLDPVHAEIFRAIQTLTDAGREASPVTVAAFMGDNAKLKAEAPEYLADICAAVPSAMSAPSYAAAVVDAWKVRTLRYACSAGLDNLTGPENLRDVASELEDALERASTLEKRRGRAPTASAMLGEIEADVRVEAPTTGWRALDDVIDGLTPKLVIVAGRPSMGKTTVARGIMLNAARQGWGVHFASLEMQAKPHLRMFCTDMVRERTRVEYNSLKNDWRDFSEPKKQALRDAAAEFDGLPIIIDETGAQSPRVIAAGARRSKRMFERKGLRLGLIVVDYLQLMATTGEGNRANQVGENAKALKNLQKELNCAVVLLAQINRAVEGRDNKRPGLADLRDSGEIEEAADVVAFCYRPEYYLERQAADADLTDDVHQDLAEFRRKLLLYVDKNREGPTTAVPLWCDVATSSVRDARIDLEREL